MSLNDNYDKYKKVNILSAGKIKSLQLLVEKALAECRLAVADRDKSAEILANVRDIMVQLQMALDLDNGDVPRNLFFLYDYIYECAEENTSESLNKAVTILKRIREMLLEIERKKA
ncbi:MAG: flagellar protein FliS [Fibrobacterota bacterium]